MNKSGGSLGGKNTPRPGSGARSSRALPTIFKNFKSLQRMDRKIGKLDARVKSASTCFFMTSGQYQKLLKQRSNADMKRKELRIKRKEYVK